MDTGLAISMSRINQSNSKFNPKFEENFSYNNNQSQQTNKHQNVENQSDEEVNVGLINLRFHPPQNGRQAS